MFNVYLYYFLMVSVKMKCCGRIITCSVTSSYLLTEVIWNVMTYFDVLDQLLSLHALFLSYGISVLLLA